MTLTPAMRRYVLHWGEMGQRWGVNRTVAQIHALLYLASAPQNAEQIVEALGVARSNVSTSLKELLGWGLIRLVHIEGDRRDHFEARLDPWDMLELIADGRKRREIDPTLEMLAACVAEAEGDADTPPHVRERLKTMQGFVARLDRWYGQMRQVPRPILIRLIGMGGRIAGLIGR
ncbi:MAG: MarR family transcriptional regulator [Caulobacter sp.]|nr:MarR family transcriptional regulator [Caulobacter sp.]